MPFRQVEFKLVDRLACVKFEDVQRLGFINNYEVHLTLILEQKHLFNVVTEARQLRQCRLQVITPLLHNLLGLVKLGLGHERPYTLIRKAVRALVVNLGV